MLLRRISEHVRAQHWTAVGIDFVIVVLGVFVGVQVDSWWDARSNARKERAYLLELKEDFAQIIKELEGDSKEYEMIAVAMVALLEESRRDAPALPVTELNRNVGRLIYMVGTPIVADTYTNLTGSGDLAIIRSQEDRILGVLSSPEFRNVVTIKWDISTDLLDVLSGALDRARTVDALLDQQLARP